MTTALVPLADGVEEMEAVIIIDTLRRAKWTVTPVAIGDATVTASRGVRLVADMTWETIQPLDYDVLIIPGGAPGVARLSAHPGVLTAIRDFHAAAKPIGAICAGPLVLQAAGILAGRHVTCHPGVARELTATQRRADRVVHDGNLITSQAPGTAFEFVLAILAAVDGPDAVAGVAPGLVL